MRFPTILFVLTLAANPVAAEELSGTLLKIKETRKVTLGFQEASVPFSYLDDNARPIGFALDICLRIVDAVKKDLACRISRSTTFPSPRRTASP